MNIKEIGKKSVNEKSNIKDNNLLKIIKGSIISIIITIIGLLIFSIILANTNINENTMIPVITILSAISILIGSLISVSKIQKKGILNGAIVGLIYIISIYIMSSCINGSFSLTLNSCILIIVSIVAGMIGGIIGVNMK